MNIEQKKVTGKNVHDLTTELFHSLEGSSYKLDKKIDNHVTLKFGQIEISVSSIKGMAYTNHLVKIQTPNFMVTSDMRYQSNSNEVDFESADMEAIFSVIKMLLIHNEYIMFQDGRMERSCEPEITNLAWQMD
jgi:hypothetical protein